MISIRIYNKISNQGLKQFNPDTYKVSSDASEPDAIILRSHSLHNEVLPKSVMAIARAGAGTNNIPVEEYSKRGIVVFNTPGANANAVKELVLCGMLAASRNIIEGVSYVRSLASEKIDDLPTLLESKKKQFSGSELYGKSFGVIGLGAIGSMIANMAEELGMKVLGYDPAISIEAAWRLSSSVVKMDSMDALLKASDFISLHVPVVDSTKHLINSDKLKLLKFNAVLLNFAREQIVDGNAIVNALNTGQFSRYVTDFPNADMLTMDKVIPMPHIGASTEEAETNCAIMAAEQVIDFIENGNIKNSVNFPTTQLNRAGACRLTFCNHNRPSMLSQVLGMLKNINVLEMLNKSRGDIAYNIMDLEQTPSEELIQSVTAIDGVSNLRLIC